MKELRSILAAYEKLKSEKDGELIPLAALATVIHVSGSAYRRPGAKMLINHDGTAIGSVSGGCLERDVVENATRLLADQTKASLLLHYDTSHDDDAVFGLGTGCTGSVLVYLEKICAEDSFNTLGLLANCMQAGACSSLIASVVKSADERLTGSKLFVQTSADYINLSCSENIEERLKDKLADLILPYLGNQKTALLNCEGLELFIEPVQPLPQLYIFGAGHDSVPLADLACAVGMRVTVLDHRKTSADPLRFPGVDAVLHYRPEDLSSWPELNSRSNCVVMAHNYSVDKEVLYTLISSDAAYIGVLGPKKRTDKMLAQFIDEGHKLSTEQLSKIYAPVGLDLGAETPEEIALAILSEIKAVAAKRDAGFLRDRKQAIHNETEAHWSKSESAESIQGSCS